VSQRRPTLAEEPTIRQRAAYADDAVGTESDPIPRRNSG
jgi:hypothetical protein